MNSSQDKNSFIKALLSVIFGMLIWILFLFGRIISLLGIPDSLQTLMIFIAYLISFIGAVMAISAKKNNISQKKSIVRISALGLIISIFDIIIFTFTLPVIALTVLFRICSPTPDNILLISCISFSVGIAIAIVFIVIYCRTKPKSAQNLSNHRILRRDAAHKLGR